MRWGVGIRRRTAAVRNQRGQVITECELDAFRMEHLSPPAMLTAIERDVRILFRLPVGVGKTYAAVDLLLCPAVFERFDLVIYAAPAWNILKEVVARIENAGFEGYKILERRPKERCGDLDAEWRQFEERSCSTLAKRRLCLASCPKSSSCPWPGQLKDIEGLRLVLMTEQRLGLLRAIVPLLQSRTGGRRVLVILDEARVLDASFEVQLARDELERFGSVLKRTRCHQPGWLATRTAWLRELHDLLGADERTFRERSFHFKNELHGFAYWIQALGWHRHGPEFRYAGYDLSLLAYSRAEERWFADDSLCFIGRPYLQCHLALLSAHVTAAYAGHRLGTGPTASPFEGIRFLHSGSRVFNVRNSNGAARHFRRNHRQVLDTFASLIMRNVVDGRSTLLISRKKFKPLCADYLQRRLAGWGLDVEIVVDGYDRLPLEPDPRTIPLIHYGIIGVNDFTKYSCAYSVNSYYVSSKDLNAAVQEFEPRHFRVRLEVVRGPDRMRRVKLADTLVSDEDRMWLGSVYLRKLEVDPVIQAVGRVRFLTEPREVVFFQMNDLQTEIGQVREVRSLRALEQALHIPSARDIDDALAGRQARRLMNEGFTAQQAAEALGVSRRTLFRRLEAFESAKFPLRNSIADFGTPPALPASPGGGE